MDSSRKSLLTGLFLGAGIGAGAVTLLAHTNFFKSNKHNHTFKYSCINQNANKYFCYSKQKYCKHFVVMHHTV